jgi:hypothetical protein
LIVTASLWRVNASTFTVRLARTIDFAVAGVGARLLDVVDVGRAAFVQDGVVRRTLLLSWVIADVLITAHLGRVHASTLTMCLARTIDFAVTGSRALLLDMEALVVTALVQAVVICGALLLTRSTRLGDLSLASRRSGVGSVHTRRNPVTLGATPVVRTDLIGLADHFCVPFELGAAFLNGPHRTCDAALLADHCASLLHRTIGRWLGWSR